MNESEQYYSNHAACGVGLLVNISNPQHENPAQHELIRDALEILANFEYRSGINPSTDECDGAGIRFFGLPTLFFNRLLREGHFESIEKDHSIVLSDSQYAIGHYFFPNDLEKVLLYKERIQQLAHKHTLEVLAWRDLGSSTVDSFLSKKCLEKKPAIWQAIIVSSCADYSVSLNHLFIDIYQELPEVHILSQSSDSMVFKGMIKPSIFKNYFTDFSAPDFTAKAAIMHGRFATNTNPQWKNAQPCNHFIAHNGEFNSAAANLIEMKQELDYHNIKALIPQTGMSDSLQFDYDLFNQLIIHKVSLIEGLIRLMSTHHENSWSHDIQVMLETFRRERTPYNGPAFIVGGADGNYFAKLDECGLRPSRWTLVELENGMQQLCAASDDYWLDNEQRKVIKKSQLSPGGMLLITPQGKIHHTSEILQEISKNYPPSHFERLLLDSTMTLMPSSHSWDLSHETQDLNRQLFACGWDFETINQSLIFMAENSQEPTAAMGDDTNPLHAQHFIAHLSYFFHQLFAQVSAPSIDSIREKDRFNLNTYLGFKKYIPLTSPILRPSTFQSLNELEGYPIKKIQTSFILDLNNPHHSFLQAISQLMIQIERGLEDGVCVFIVTDEGISENQAMIPDLIAVAAIKKVLSDKKNRFKCSIIVNSLQITGPHQVSCLLAIGAQAVFARGAYLKLKDLYDDFFIKFENYCKALEKSLLKTMGKLGITDVNNYINGQFIAALGLDLQSDVHEISLASLFGQLYSPLKGMKLQHITKSVMFRHQLAFDQQNQFNPLPRSGYYMSEKSGIVHGYSPEVMNAFTVWIKEENLKASLYQMHLIFEKRYQKFYVKNLEEFQVHHGFIDPSQKIEGFYPPIYFEQFRVSSAFLKLSQILNDFKHRHPTCLRDYLKLKEDLCFPQSQIELQSQASIRQCLFSGSMSQGALTVASPEFPEQIGAHETLTRGMNAIGAISASGEGGENFKDLRISLFSTKSKQIASGRFGISARQILEAQEMEIKISQGAKPGEGGELPGNKVSIRFAAQRGGLPGSTFVSPPPHHDIYSIEDLEQLIRDIKTVNPNVEVAVKLVASKGIGTIAVGVAKAGADVINIASHSGGTAAAQQSSIKHAGLPGEIGLVEVDSALRQATLRGLVKLRTSGGIKTASDIIVSAILGADQFELGTTAMITLGCKMQRTCNKSCQPGVATDGHLFKGDQITTERFFVNLAAEVQEHLKEIGISNLSALRGQTQFLKLIDAPEVQFYDFGFLLRHQTSIFDEDMSDAKQKRLERFENLKEKTLIQTIHRFFQAQPESQFISEPIELNAMDLSFGAGIAGAFVRHLEAHPNASIHLNTYGIAGQSFGFVMPKGISIYHKGIVQDGCGKSMTGGEMVIQNHTNHSNFRAHEHTLGGNALFYGASGGNIYINGQVGHRFGILMKGAQVVVEGVGDLAFEYMTSGTALILGKTGKGLGTGATGGIIISYVKEHDIQAHESFNLLNSHEASFYEKVIQRLLLEHTQKTKSELASNILDNFSMQHFKVFVAKEFSKINTLIHVNEVLKTYQIRHAPLTLGMQVWLEQTIFKILSQGISKPEVIEEFQDLIKKNSVLFNSKAYAKMHQQLIKISKDTNTVIVHEEKDNPELIKIRTKKIQPVKKRLSSLAGELDELLMDVFSHLNAYISNLRDEADGCSGCRAQSCAGGEKVDTGCPSGKSINSINSTLKKLGLVGQQYLTKEQWRLLREAFELQIKESPFIAYTGAVCPAPCQDACTESIPDYQVKKSVRGKPVGEPVHIKQIEFLLYQLGRALGWFDGQKQWTQEEINYLFGSSELKYHCYDLVMSTFKNPFQIPEKKLQADIKKLIVVGSGPSGMQIAYEGLHDGLEVQMYERSNKPGGLLADGIPAHKFDKTYLTEDFQYLQNMGLQLFLNSEVIYSEDEEVFKLEDKIIASVHDKNTIVALCIGAGLPRELPQRLTSHLSTQAKNKIIQANAFLKAVNEVADILKSYPEMSEEQSQKMIQEKLSHMDPRGKKIVVLGGGDTAQDIIRWVARYFNHSESLSSLEVLVRGPEFEHRGLMDAYPHPSRAPTVENYLKVEEILYVQGQVSHLVETQFIIESDDKLSVGVTQSKYLNYDIIRQDEELKKIFEELPREQRLIDQSMRQDYQIDGVDMIICALGFQGRYSFEIAQKLDRTGLQNVFYAGDASDSSPQIIVGAQANAKNTYLGQIRNLFYLKPTLVNHSLFESSKIMASKLSISQKGLLSAHI